MSTAHAENKMGTMPVNRLLISMSLPIVVSMLVQALYNVVDSLFVSRISENALTAVSLAFPVQNLMIGISTGTGVGMNALLSRCLGEKNHEEAGETARNGVFLYAMSSLLFVVLGLGFSRLFFELQTDIPEIIEGGAAYIRICTVASFGLFGQIMCERLLQSTGRAFYSMVTQLLGAVINIILDPILIFGLLGFPKMGIVGAALATVIGQICSLTMGVYLNITKNPEIRLHFKGFRPSGRIIRKIYSVGFPSILMNSISSVMTFCMNQILMAFTATATAVFGVYFKLQSFVFMPVFGLNNGMVPIISYNYGARNKARIMETLRLSVAYAVGIMLIGLIIIQIFPGQLLMMFDASENMLDIGKIALRVISLSFVFAGFGVVSSSVFQALGNGVYSLLVSLVRQLLVILPAAWLLGRLGGLNAVWWSFPIAELFSVCMCALYLKKILQEKVDVLP
ncbi:MAG: MATE family efflux transporter [Clostridia bacterium]|nr:MATE family efflux transporter [Clostridia bacterium]